MARKSLIEREKKREKLVQSKWEKRQELKKIVRNLTVSEDERWSAQIALNKMPKNSSKVRLRNRCQITGRPRGYIRKFKISRLCFRENINNGLIPGGFKASW